MTRPASVLRPPQIWPPMSFAVCMTSWPVPLTCGSLAFGISGTRARVVSRADFAAFLVLPAAPEGALGSGALRLRRAAAAASGLPFGDADLRSEDSAEADLPADFAVLPLAGALSAFGFSSFVFFVSC